MGTLYVCDFGGVLLLCNKDKNEGDNRTMCSFNIDQIEKKN